MISKKARSIHSLIYVPVEKIKENESQPRREFDTVALENLAQSIKENGVIQPLCVRRTKEGCFRLVSGERRLRAAQMAGLKRVPCVISDTDDKGAALLAIIENIQRENLSCFEEAESIYKLITAWGLTREEVATKLSMAQSTLSNKLRLLKLTAWQKERIAASRLSERHARALLRIEDNEQRDDTLLTVIAKGLNVSETEKLIDSIIKKKNENAPHRRVAVGDIRLFANTINNAVDTMRRSGVNATAEKNETDQFIEYKIVIPKNALQSEAG